MQSTVFANLRKIRISPKKLNDVAKLIRKQPLERALAILSGVKKECALYILKTVKSAAANAKNNMNLSGDLLFVTEASVGKSIVLRRLDIRGRSRSGRITKPFSHLRIALSVQAPAEKKRDVSHKDVIADRKSA
jgi:large subunit ribosomal protein L22